jgi:hypothetical protein
MIEIATRLSHIGQTYFDNGEKEEGCRLSHVGQTYFDMGRRRREGGQNEQKGTPLMSFWRCVSSMVLVIVITMPKGVKKKWFCIMF